MSDTDKEGTSISGILNCLKSLNFNTKAVRLNDLNQINDVPLPCIAHMKLQNGLLHYVVIYAISKNSVSYMDPANGFLKRIKKTEFLKEWNKILILMIPNEDFKSENLKIPVLRRLILIASQNRKLLIQAVVAALFYTILGLSTSIYVQKIVDYVLVDGNIKLLNIMSIAMLTILLFQLSFGVLRDLIVVRSGNIIDFKLIVGYYRRLFQLPQTYFDSMQSGDILSRIGDAANIKLILNDTVISVMTNFFIVIFSFAIMFSFYWKLALIISLMLPFYIIVYIISNKLNRRIEKEFIETSADLESHLVETINSPKTIRAFNLQSFSKTKLESKFIKLLRIGYTSRKNDLFTKNSSMVIARVFTVLLLWIGSKNVLDNTISSGELLSFYSLIAYLIGPVNSLVSLNKTIVVAKVSSERLFEVFDLSVESIKDEFIILNREELGNIRFENVEFGYGSSPLLLNNLDLEFKKGEITALVGESGSGKSTISSLLQKIYPVSEGKIMIGDFNLNDINTSSLIDLIGLVPQDIVLFKGTIMDNIALGYYNPDTKRIYEICHFLGIMEFIESLPNGIKTDVGVNGSRLSGGQKQKIAFARALYKKPEIFILDEASSSLDSLSESHLNNVLEILKEQDKIIIVIGHKKSSISLADKIYLIKDGKVLEEGNHQSLIESKQFYYNLIGNS